MKILRPILSLACLFIAISGFSQSNPWRKIAVPVLPELSYKLDAYQTFELDETALKSSLMEIVGGTHSKELLLPIPDGSFEAFTVVESSVMMPGIQARYPQIRCFAGQSRLDSRFQVRMGIDDNGFYALFIGPNGQASIAKLAGNNYVSFWKKDKISNIEGKLSSCGGTHEQAEEAILQDKIDRKNLPGRAFPTNQVDEKSFRIAIATTGEYATVHGGTYTSVMSHITLIINLVNVVMHNDWAVKLIIAENNDSLINFDAANDPYTNGIAGAMINENNTFIPTKIPLNSYDVGHVFGTVSVAGVVGLAELYSVCKTNSKGRGISNQPTWTVGDDNYFSTSLVAHELGHQFGCNHTFNNCDGNENPPTAFEPGSGSTIMSYAGACGIQNIQGSSDDYYHANSLESALNNIYTGTASTCATNLIDVNTVPVVTILSPNNLVIPFGTPFQLDGIATDAQGDNLTYCWEEMDLGPLSPLGAPLFDAPAFRTYPPQASGRRYLPNINRIVTNSSDNAEVLPTTSRNFAFRMTVRDNNPAGGGVEWKETKFTSIASSGPFLVLYPNSAVVFPGGAYIEAKWDVSNTEKTPINCQKVRLLMSRDGGLTYPDTLLTETLNDGAAWVTLPNLSLSKCRLKVEAIGNIFFDISNENFAINVTQPGFALKIAPLTDRISVCAPDSARINFTVASVGGFNGDVTFVDVQGLPAEATYAFSKNPLSPGESTQLAIYVPTSLAGNEYSITVRVTGAGLDTTERYFNLIVVSNDFSALELLLPADGENAASLLPTFTWIVGGTVDVFRVQIATGPDFETQTILDELTNSIFSYQPSVVLDENTIYFWRIQPINACGSGAFTKPSAFKTATLVCEEFTTSVPVVISKQGTPTVDSPINVTSIGTVSDVNITSLIGNHEAFKDLKGSLVSPGGKIVDLWASKCGLVNVNFNFGFDDETPSDFECLPNKAKLFKPLMPLSGMVGEAKNGNWILRITDQVATSGGNLSSWKIKVCGNGSALAPLIVNNQPLPCKPGDEAKVTHEFLKAEDGITNVEYMVFTLVSLPEFGDLHLYGNVMKVGDQFTQADLQVFGALVYDNTQGSTFDGFDFIVQNGLNGFAGIDHFSIVIDVNSSVNPTPQVLHFKVSPNPANAQVLVELGDTGENVQYSLMTIDGKKYLTGDIKGRQLSLSTSGIPAGIYWLQVTGSKGTGIQKLIIQH